MRWASMNYQTKANFGNGNFDENWRTTA